MDALNIFSKKHEDYEAMSTKELVDRIFAFDSHFNDIKRTELDTKRWEKLKADAVQARDSNFQISEDKHDNLSLNLTISTIIERPQLFSLKHDHAALYKDGFHAVLDKREDGLYAIARQKDGTTETFAIKPAIGDLYTETEPVIVSGDVKCTDNVNWIRIPVTLDLDPIEKNEGLSKKDSYVYTKGAKLWEKNDYGIPRFPEASKVASEREPYETMLKTKLTELFPENNPIQEVTCGFGKEDEMWMKFETTVRTNRPLTAQEIMDIDSRICEQENTNKIGIYSFDPSWDFVLNEVTDQDDMDFADAISNIPVEGHGMEQ